VCGQCGHEAGRGRKDKKLSSDNILSRTRNVNWILWRLSPSNRRRA
jgi:hypothetical protein